MNTMPYEVWSRDDGVLLCEGSFESLIQALPYARTLGESTVIIDSTLTAKSVSRLDPGRVVAYVSETGTFTLNTPDASLCPADMECEPATTIYWSHAA